MPSKGECRLPDSAPNFGAIVLFDGVCNFCNASINFVIDRDPSAHFRFAPLQSAAGQAILSRHGLPTDSLDSVVLVEGDRCYRKSAAALRIASRLAFPWRLAVVGWALPRFLRDGAYDFIARHRYRWFGKRDQCRLPNPDLQRRFLA